MRTPTLLLAAAVAVLAVLPSSTSHPVGCGCPKFQPPKGAYVKASKSSSSSSSVAKSASGDEQEIKANSLTGEYSKRASSSASNSLARSAESNAESYEAYTPGYVCGVGLLARNSGESDYDYYLRVFRVDVANAESLSAFYAAVFKQYKGESNVDYINRVNFIFTKVYPKLDCRFNQAYLKFLQKYYLIAYAKLDGETDDAWFTRVLTRSTLNEAEYLVKVAILKKYITFVDWSKVDIDCKYKTGFILISSKGSSARSLEESSSSVVLTEEEVRKTFAKIESEDITTYYKRIVTKLSVTESTEEYVRTLTLVRKCYPTLSLWYDVRYIDLVRNYYSSLYARLTDETDEKYFLRIVTKEPFETEDQFTQRIELVHRLYPNLVLWSDPKYYSTITQKFYLTYYKKTSSEDETTYFKRVITRCVGESDIVYINRLNLIRQTFSGLDLWYSKEFLDISKQYYITKYTKISSETEESFFKRIVAKEVGESEEQSIKRISLVRELFPNLVLWTDEKYYDLTKNLYLTIYKKSSSEDEITYFKRIIARIPKESDECYISRLNLVKRTYSSLNLWYSSEFLSITKQYYITRYTKTSSEDEVSFYKRVTIKEVGETPELWAQRVELIHQIYPNWALWYDTKYYELTKNVYLTFYKKSSAEDELSYYKRLTKKFASETEEVYISRLTLIKQTYSTLDLWYNTQYLDVVKSYYVARYTKTSSETEESLFKRVCVREDGETVEKWAQRVEIIHQLNPNWALWYDVKYYTLTKDIYLNFYKKSTSEDEITYFKRITAKTVSESDVVYINRLDLIRRTYSGLNLWYSKQYLDVTKSYYIAKYTRGSSETEESLFKRIVVKESCETVEQYAERVEIVRQLYPNLVLWSDVKYYDLVKSVYQIVYKKSTSEDEITYFKRITTRTLQETDAVYLGRLTLIENTFSSLSLWSSVENLSIIKSFYSLKYAKLAGESNEAYFARLVAKESCDISDEVYVKRLYIVQLLTSSSSLWYDVQFYEKYTKTFYSLYYAKLESESCDGWLTRAITLLPGETNENAIKRVTLIKRASGNCGCWTVDTLSKVAASKAFSAEYISLIRSSFFGVSYTKTSSSSSSSTKSATSEANEDVVVVKRGGC
ncbi:uncharacterized protein LOC124353960 [Homalodisca vitripennis]|nr:uncharacterized protein LOC124353960 [Homalodisca vitripennis]KAG8287323.1 hypothetical protein J6590_041567 [Homalodisca vitripennis]